MKSYELKPTRENLLDTFLNDSISRNIDIFRFVDILNAIDDCCSIAVDGNWGCGKTFFVKQVKMVMDAYNKNINNKHKETQENINHKRSQYRSSDDLKQQVCIYYDAWQNDNDKDPMLSLIYSITQSVREDFSPNKNISYVKLAASILDFFTGKNFEKIIENLKRDNPLEEIKKEKNTQDTIKEFLDNIMCERGNRLVIFIDELDRCKPEFAVKLLERVKHYFENDKITFVFSINMKELQHTIRRYYGDNFSAGKYLDRFFDLRVSLPKPDYKKLYRSMSFDDSQYTYDTVCAAVIEAYHFELREVAKFLRLAKIAAYKPTHDASYSFSLLEEGSIQFCLMYLIPIMIGIKIHDLGLYEEFISGKNCNPLLDISVVLGESFFYGLLNNNEPNDSPNEDETRMRLQEKQKEIYHAIFVEPYNHVCVGRYAFRKDTKEILVNTVGLLSKYVDLVDD